MRTRKWVTSILDEDGGRKREIFQIAPVGKRALLEWLRRPFDRPDVIHGLETLLLRFAFFDGNLSRREACHFLASLERELGEYVRELENYGAKFGLLNSLNTGALAFSNGLHGYRAQLSWTRRVRKILSRNHFARVGTFVDG
jgi:DNA-binding PadR family transcriptional regulator